jgi:hypothetical protein
VIPGGFIPSRRLSVLRVPVPALLADCTDSRTRRFGLTGEIHSSDEREQTRIWAEALAQAGFGGIRYLVRHDPSQREIGIALFGPGGEADWPVVSTELIGFDLILSAERRFGITVQMGSAVS